MVMAKRRQARIQAIDFARCSNHGEKKPDWERFINTGELGQSHSEPLTITPRIAYHMRRIKENGGHFVMDNGTDPFDPEAN
jgi:hypothetical protein